MCAVASHAIGHEQESVWDIRITASADGIHGQTDMVLVRIADEP